jgi:hypothetical protein
MIITSYNVRGLGGLVKRRKIRELIRKHNIQFLAILETKLEAISDKLCYSLWGSNDCDWSFRPSEGNSGGILSIWCKSISSPIFSFAGEGFVGVCLEWGVMKEVCFIVNIYAKCDLSSKRRMWNNLVLLKRGLGGGKWCVMGDFNSVSRMEERRRLVWVACKIQLWRCVNLRIL